MQMNAWGKPMGWAQMPAAQQATMPQFLPQQGIGRNPFQPTGGGMARPAFLPQHPGLPGPMPAQQQAPQQGQNPMLQPPAREDQADLDPNGLPKWLAAQVQRTRMLRDTGQLITGGMQAQAAAAAGQHF